MRKPTQEKMTLPEICDTLEVVRSLVAAGAIGLSDELMDAVFALERAVVLKATDERNG